MNWIDIHMHIGKIVFGKPRLTARDVLVKMDELGIEKACLLPIENPEETDYYVTTAQVIAAARRHPDRLIPFCNIDPRRREASSFDPLPMIKSYVERGCRGFGESLSGLWVDDKRLQKIYAACGELGIPILIHMDRYRNRDYIGLPRLERMLRKFPETVFIGHATHWWSEISADVTREDLQGYPRRKVVPGGRVDYLLQNYPNVYGDLSAGSGDNAMTRDREFARSFLERNQDKLLFGTDLVYKGQKVPNAEHLQNSGITKEALEKIGFKNAQRLLGL